MTWPLDWFFFGDRSDCVVYFAFAMWIVIRWYFWSPLSFLIEKSLPKKETVYMWFLPPPLFPQMLWKWIWHLWPVELIFLLSDYFMWNWVMGTWWDLQHLKPDGLCCLFLRWLIIFLSCFDSWNFKHSLSVRLITVVCHIEKMTEIYRISSDIVYTLLTPVMFKDFLLCRITEEKLVAAFLICKQSYKYPFLTGTSS